MVEVTQGDGTVPTPTTPRPTTNDLAYTDASPMVSLAVGGVLVLLDSRLLVAVRRRRSTQR